MESNQNISDHRVMVDSKPFQRAADFAVMQYQVQLALDNDLTKAAANHMKMTGALEFLQTFRLLAESSKPAAVRAPSDNLNHQLS